MADNIKDHRTFSVTEPIAIVSVACRLPGHSNNPQKLWELLLSGNTASSQEVPASRFNTAGHFDNSGRPGTLKALSGMFIEDIDPAVFDASFFNLTRADAIAMDPQQRQLLEVVYECFENGGISLERVSGTQTACFVGSYTVDYHDMQSREPSQRPSGMTVGIGRAILSNRISHFYNLKGPSWTIDTACSGGLVGVDAACQYLRARKINGAIVAAANLWMSPEHTQELGTMRAAYSATGKCHTFDTKADGYCRAEAVNAVYLKRLSDAIHDGDPIRAVIRGTANNSDGWTPGINSPDAEAQAAVIRAAYADAGIAPSNFNDTGFLECHGTGTPAGDPLEVRGAASVLSQNRDDSQPLFIGSIKSNIGHSEPGAGLSGLIKATQVVEQGYIPGNPTFLTPNPNIDFEKLRVRASRPGFSWKSTYRRASINSFGYGGSNAHAIVDCAEHFLRDQQPARSLHRPYASSFSKPGDMLSLRSRTRDRSTKVSPRLPQLLVFSANDTESLNDQIKGLSAHLLDPRVNVKISDLAYTLSERRTRHFCRAFATVFPLKSGYASVVPDASVASGQVPDRGTKIGFVFTGQGAQWPQMGLDLLTYFPTTVVPFLKGLDTALQALPAYLKPAWSLLEELSDVRSSDHFSKAEFSQPLVTALQLAQLQVLKRWNVRPRVVVGHSSGEIAAAYSAGHLTAREAILLAYFRGLAAKDSMSSVPMSMMAVGMSSTDIQPYLEHFSEADGLAIACYNSPKSITISGPVEALTRLLSPIKSDGHFARILRVEVAYHSFHLQHAASRYERLINDYVNLDIGSPETSSSTIVMVSSVTGKVLLHHQARTATYWKDNMMAPVRFESACRTTLADTGMNANFLIELGPSNALAAPVAQTAKDMNIEDIKYVGAWKRGQDSILAIFDVAGQLFLRNAEVSLEHVNHNELLPKCSVPAVVIDLPNYKWNHSTQYWYESVVSKEWRFKTFPEHDLLGSKVLGTLWQNPTWHKKLRLSDLPWLRDHRIGSEILFPAAGYIAMSVEAVRQAEVASKSNTDSPQFDDKKTFYDLRDIEFSRGLVLEEDTEVDLMLTLTPIAAMGHGWWEYKIFSSPESEMEKPGALSSTSWTENSSGLVRIRSDDVTQFARDQSNVRDFMHPVPAKLWHKAMENVGYAFGPAFRTQLQFECMEGSSCSRALLSLTPPSSRWEPQSQYPLHVCALDGCIQSVFPSLYNGRRSDFQSLLLPRSIGQMTLSARTWSSGQMAALSSSNKGSSDVSVYNFDSGEFIMDFKELVFSPMKVKESPRLLHTFAHVEWRPDITHVNSDDKVQKVLSNVANEPELHVQELLDLIAHKTPNLKVLELSLDGQNSDALWLAGNLFSQGIRSACSGYHFGSANAAAVLAMEQQLARSSLSNARASLLNLHSETFQSPSDVFGYHLVLVSDPVHSHGSGLTTLLKNLYGLLKNGGCLIWNGVSRPSAPGIEALNGEIIVDLPLLMKDIGFVNICESSQSCVVCEVSHEKTPDETDTLETPNESSVGLLSFLDEESSIITELSDQIQDRGWNVTHLSPDHDIENLQRSIVIILDELIQPVFKTMTDYQLSTLQRLSQKECYLLWVTEGSQMRVVSPEKAIAQGVFRSIRAEMPTMHVTTLDLDPTTAISSSTRSITICEILQRIKDARDVVISSVEEEFAERDGLLYISRIRRDTMVNKFKDEEDAGRAPLAMRDFYASTHSIHLVTERPGDLEVPVFVEDDAVEVLEPADVEVEIHAMGCNPQDLNVAVRADLGQPYRLGNEAAGVITRVGNAVDNRHIGQRVALFGRGCFANRTTVSTNATLPLPQDMSFVEAATLPVAFATAIYGLCDLARLQRNQRVLVDFSIGNTAFAVIRLCQYLGCKVFVVVRGEEDRCMLVDEHSINEDAIILSARLTDNGGLMPGLEIDVVVQRSPDGTSQRDYRQCLSSGGVVIQVKSGILQSQNPLSLEPTNANLSVHYIDAMALPATTVSSVFSRLSRLIDDGLVKGLPLGQIFSLKDASIALRTAQNHNHARKVVISESPQPGASVPVRLRPRSAKMLLNPHHTYLLVGGLKGICGTLAVHLASLGAKHIAAMSRSGYQDGASQRVIANIKKLGCTLDLLCGDVTCLEDVKACYNEIGNSIGGIVQGAALFRDSTFEAMSHANYHAAISCKVQGTINLHTVALETQQPIAFFTMLSSISGVVGTKGQANYAGGNAFQDAFASYRRRLGLPAISIDLGPVQDVGVMQDNDDLQSRFDDDRWVHIDESVLRQIFDYALLQQAADPRDRLNINSEAQMVTGLRIPQPDDSELFAEARFQGLRAAKGLKGREPAAVAGAGGDDDLQALMLLTQATDPNKPAILSAAVGVVGTRLKKQLRLKEEVEPTRQLLQYGMDSLAAVDFRNWVRTTFKVELTTLDIVNATSMLRLCEKIIGKMGIK